jgi:DNA-binding transcriptional regulator LsrR (DeoR family)
LGKGAYFDSLRKPSVDTVEIQRLKYEEKLGATEIARRLGVGRASVYRALANNGRQA